MYHFAPVSPTYIMFQSTKYKFNSSEVDPKCPLCRLESEDLQHFILRCPALAKARDRYFPLIRKLVIDAVGEITWSEHFCNRDILVTLVIDCQKLAENRLLPRSTDTLFEIESCSRTLCYKLHQLRLNLNYIKNFKIYLWRRSTCDGRHRFKIFYFKF